MHYFSLSWGHLGIETGKKENQPLQGVELWIIFLTKKENWHISISEFRSIHHLAFPVILHIPCNLKIHENSLRQSEEIQMRLPHRYTIWHKVLRRMHDYLPRFPRSSACSLQSESQQGCEQGSSLPLRGRSSRASMQVQQAGDMCLPRQKEITTFLMRRCNLAVLSWNQSQVSWSCLVDGE